MTHYKGFTIWWNNLQNKYMVQTGYYVLASYDTIKGAKIAISNKWVKQ